MGSTCSGSACCTSSSLNAMCDETLGYPKSIADAWKSEMLISTTTGFQAQNLANLLGSIPGDGRVSRSPAAEERFLQDHYFEVFYF
jgi:hypothetical protein